ncbi:hypothetical protein TH61_00345 [Rufibacter sp. DG15C]|uniref:hypothetical protein n=1 Tax=Rufibacter sp. DG15C TaxID=1379909 RepID=UPI00078E9D7C|nr:hypothetical protein [Rufibacter sp. DG15C]AMM49933.1 hypothetical protein TH61_00345 [Rufibacter sp. DG15C]
MKKITSIWLAAAFGFCMITSPLAAQDTTKVQETNKEKAKHGTHQVGHGTKEVGKGTKKVVVAGAKATGKGAKKAGKAVKKTVKKGVDKVD